MARQREDPGHNLQPDEITERVADPEALGGSQALSGFLGRSADGGRWRLYETPALDSYYEFDEGDVVHSVKHESELGGTTVWLRHGAPVKHTIVTSTAAQQSFLQGPMTRAATRAGGAAPQRIAPWPTRIDCTWGPCHSWFVLCRRSWIDACRTWICGPQDSFVCGLGGGPVAEMMAETRASAGCLCEGIPRTHGFCPG